MLQFSKEGFIFYELDGDFLGLNKKGSVYTKSLNNS